MPKIIDTTCSQETVSTPAISTRTPSFAQPASLLRVCGVACDLVRSRHTLPLMSLAAMLTAAAFTAPTYAQDAGSESSSESSGEGGGCPNGDCGSEDGTNKDSESLDNEDGEVCQDEAECPCDNGGGARGQTPSDPPVGGGLHPVTWDTGEKWEQMSDLYVKVKGKDFQLTRQYSSHPDMLTDLYNELIPATYSSTYTGTTVPDLPANPSVGTGWAFSNLRGIVYREVWGCVETSCQWQDGQGNSFTEFYDEPVFHEATAWLSRPGRKPRAFKVPALTGGSGVASNSTAPGNQGIYGSGITREYLTACDGPENCTINESLDLPSGYINGTLVFEDPGRWRQEFELTGYTGRGWISREEDEYGNTRDYVDDSGLGVSGMPDYIYLNGEYNSGTTTWENYEAKIRLYWQNFDFDPSGGTNEEPLLVRAEVYRPGASIDEMTQYVEYYHLDTSGANDAVKFHDGTSYQVLENPATSTDLIAADDLGTHGDLVQVVRYTAVDPEATIPTWQAQTTQYRYHDGSIGAPTTGDIRLRIEGDDHQLKMVFKPQQLEYIAQQRLGSGTPDDMTAVEEAYKLLAIDDDGVADSTNGIDMYEVAEKIVSYADSLDSPVERQFLQATSCGCGGGATSAVLRTYEQIDGWETDIGGTLDIPGESMHITEYKVTDFSNEPTTAYRTLAYDMILLGPDDDKPYLWMKAVVEEDGAITERGGNPATDDPRAWVTEKEYDLTERAVTGRLWPSMFSDYTLAATGTPNTAPSATMVSDGGYGERYTYDVASKNENVGERKVVTRSSGSFANTKVFETEYKSGAEYEKFLPTTKTRYRGTGGATDEETVSYTYRQETDTAKLDWRSITIERETYDSMSPDDDENGHATEDDATWWEFYDDSGKLIWEVDPDGVLTRYEYDFNTGVLVKVVRNSEHPDDLTTPVDTEDPLYATLEDLVTTGATFPVSASITGTPLTTEYEVDLLGRTTQITRPGGVETSISREMREDSLRPGILYYSKVLLPHEVDTGVFSGPARVRYMDAAYKTTRSSTYELDSSGSDYTYSSVTYGLGTELSRSAAAHALSGSATKQKVWWELGETHEAIHETSIEYDEHGRVNKVTDAENTVTENVHDALDRVIESKVGTTISPPVTVAEYFYDGLYTGTVTDPTQGVGNGNITGVKLYDGETSAARITRMYYDERDRLIATVTPDSAMSVTKYDNLDRPVEDGAYDDPSSVPSQSSIETLADSVPNTDATFGARKWHALTDYSQRGLVWRQRVAIDPDDGTSPEYLEWLSWFDAEGNTLSSWEPNAPMTVYEYDEHDRVSKLYVSDRLTEATGSLTHANAVSVSGDTVLEQAEYTYDDDNGGVLELIETKMRVHDATATGALADADSITSYLGLIYDDALRQQATVNFGTNKATFADGTSTTPTLSSYDTLAELRSATGVLFSWQGYNTRGMVDEVVAIQSGTTAADEIRTKYLYDDLYRTFAVIENYDDATLAWNTTEGRYVASSLDHTDLAEDRITSFVHDKVNKVTKRVAHIAAESGGSTVEDAQITEYVYGVTAGSTSNVMDSLVASNNLLTRVKYPDESTGEPGAASKYYVDYAFNRLGELRGVTDQNQTIRQFERDEQGRVTADLVDTIAVHTGTNARNIDGTIKRIGYAYDALGRMTNATSHTSTASSGNVRDEIEIEYTPLWQVEKIYQQHDGSVSTSTSPAVEYVYSNADPDGAKGNYSRLEKVRYPTDQAQSPTRDTVQYVYGTDDINDRISRVSKLQVLGLNGTMSGSDPAYADLIDYERIGLGMTAKATIGLSGAWDVMLDRTVDHEGDRVSGAYPAFDKFGRIVSHMWVRDDFGEHGSVSDLSNQPAYMEVTHTYDRSSNRLSYNDNRQGAKLPDRNRAFTYDRLNRLTEELRTPIPSGSTYTSQHMSHQWSLDMLGNWVDKVSDADHDGSFTDNQGTNYKDDREHNMANEIESGLQYDQRLYSSGTTPTFYDHIYDDNGNMTDERASKTLPTPPALMAGQLHTYDAWNRLVKTEYVPTSGSNTDVSVNTYNALGWRTSREFDESTGAFDGLDQKRLYYYGADWRMLEERIDTDVDTDSDSAGGTDDDTDWIGQQFWGIRYIDDAVGKRVDRDGDGDFIDADCSYWYQLTDTQFSVGVVLNETGFVYERIEYDAYGQAKHRFGGDTNGNGQYDYFDISGFYGSGSYTISDTTNYHADLDRNADGSINALDVGTSPSALPSGWISDPSSSDGPDNTIGYAGYVFNHEREDYTVRFRNYNPELGRWMQRDPIGYFDGTNLYAYVRSNPMFYTDSIGLAACTRDNEGEERVAAVGVGYTVDGDPPGYPKKHNTRWIEDTDTLDSILKYARELFKLKNAPGKLGLPFKITQKTLDTWRWIGDRAMEAATTINIRFMGGRQWVGVKKDVCKCGRFGCSWKDAGTDWYICDGNGKANKVEDESQDHWTVCTPGDSGINTPRGFNSDKGKENLGKCMADAINQTDSTLMPAP